MRLLLITWLVLTVVTYVDADKMGCIKKCLDKFERCEFLNVRNSTTIHQLWHRIQEKYTCVIENNGDKCKRHVCGIKSNGDNNSTSNRLIYELKGQVGKIWGISSS